MKTDKGTGSTFEIQEVGRVPRASNWSARGWTHERTIGVHIMLGARLLAYFQDHEM